MVDLHWGRGPSKDFRLCQASRLNQIACLELDPTQAQLARCAHTWVASRSPMPATMAGNSGHIMGF